MQLNISTDYGIRILLYLGKKQQNITAHEICEQMKVPENYILKVIAKLRKAGLIGSVSGIGGGYFLKKQLDEISIGEVLSILEPSMAVNRCMESDHYCSREATEYCQICKFYHAMSDDIEKNGCHKALMKL